MQYLKTIAAKPKGMFVVQIKDNKGHWCYVGDDIIGAPRKELATRYFTLTAAQTVCRHWVANGVTSRVVGYDSPGHFAD